MCVWSTPIFISNFDVSSKPFFLASSKCIKDRFASAAGRAHPHGGRCQHRRSSGSRRWACGCAFHLYGWTRCIKVVLLRSYQWHSRLGKLTNSSLVPGHSSRCLLCWVPACLVVDACLTVPSSCVQRKNRNRRCLDFYRRCRLWRRPSSGSDDARRANREQCECGCA